MKRIVVFVTCREGTGHDRVIANLDEFFNEHPDVEYWAAENESDEDGSGPVCGITSCEDCEEGHDCGGCDGGE